MALLKRIAEGATPTNGATSVNSSASNTNTGTAEQNSDTLKPASSGTSGGIVGTAANTPATNDAGASNSSTPAASPVQGQTSPVQAAGSVTPATPVTPVGTSYSFSRSSTAGTTPVTYTPTGLYNQANLDKYNADREQQIRDLYAAAQQNTLAGLKTAYDQNISDANAALDKISPQYQERMNALSSEYERQRRNNNMQAAANGLNTGAGSQMALAQSAAYQANQGKLARSEQEAINDANKRILDLQNTYQNAIAEAAANNNYKLAAAMLDEYQNAYNRQLNLENTNYQRMMQAEEQNYNRQWNEDERAYTRSGNEAALKAQYGDFSGYKDLYGDEIGSMMEQSWALQNPQIAWAAGKISAEDYEKITGYAPKDATGSGSGTSNAGSGFGGNDKFYDENSDFYHWFPSRGGRGYSASRDKAYRGAPGYLNANGQFVTGWSDDAPAPGHEQDYAVAQAYADAYNESQNSYLSNLYAQDTYQNYDPTKTWSERVTGK